MLSLSLRNSHAYARACTCTHSHTRAHTQTHTCITACLNTHTHYTHSPLHTHLPPSPPCTHRKLSKNKSYRLAKILKSTPIYDAAAAAKLVEERQAERPEGRVDMAQQRLAKAEARLRQIRDMYATELQGSSTGRGGSARPSRPGGGAGRGQPIMPEGRAEDAAGDSGPSTSSNSSASSATSGQPESHVAGEGGGAGNVSRAPKRGASAEQEGTAAGGQLRRYSSWVGQQIGSSMLVLFGRST